MGLAFQNPHSRKELNDIASKPSHEHIFQVENFDALRDIQNQLKEKIFAIEGKSEMKVLTLEAITHKCFPFLDLDPLVIATNSSLWVLMSNIRSSKAEMSFSDLVKPVFPPGTQVSCLLPGTQTISSSSFELEMSQEGFSAVFSPVSGAVFRPLM